MAGKVAGNKLTWQAIIERLEDVGGKRFRRNNWIGLLANWIRLTYAV